MSSVSAREFASSLVTGLIKDVKGFIPPSNDEPAPPVRTPRPGPAQQRRELQHRPPTAPAPHAPQPPAESAKVPVDTPMSIEELQIALAQAVALMRKMQDQQNQLVDRISKLPGDPKFLSAILKSLEGSGILNDVVERALNGRGGANPVTTTTNLRPRVSKERGPDAILYAALLGEDHPINPCGLDVFMLSEENDQWLPCPQIEMGLQNLIIEALRKEQAGVGSYYYVTIDKISVG